MNGSFKIVRKVLLKFTYNRDIINLSYELMELSNHKSNKLFNFYNINKTEMKSKELFSVLNCGWCGEQPTYLTLILLIMKQD